MTNFKTIYATQADQYEAMVSHEDYQGNILPTLQAIRPFSNLTVVELGAGTGRLTRLMTPFVKCLYAFDISPHMLQVGKFASGQVTSSSLTLGHSSLTPDYSSPSHPHTSLSSLTWAAADNRHLPIKNQTADLVIAGWSLGHSVGWYPETWREEIGRVLVEMERVIRPNGTQIILETLGTGRETPQPPTEGLASYYAWLEAAHGFTRTWIRTDYRFEAAEQAAHLTRFFFGNEMADSILRENITILPECTGIWVKTQKGDERKKHQDK
jgi:ubiquinone/menaquinone biosynthesis C-methylase UbiE